MKNYMFLKSMIIALVLLNSTACQSQPKAEPITKTLSMEDSTAEKTEQAIVNVGLIYLKEGQEKNFEKYRSRTAALLEEYGARLERMIQPKMIVAGDLELPDEIHFVYFPNKKAKNDFEKDQEALEIRKKYAGPSIEKMAFFPTQLSDFNFKREIGDSKKTYGIALVYFKEGEEYEQQFADYHKEACKIIPEFGAHFERFLEPTGANGFLDKPDEIHRFYFESPDGMKKMGKDERMLKLFPERDASLRKLIFIIGEAL